MDFSVIQLYAALMRDLGVDKDTERYVSKRLSSEGLHFVTVLLPSFSKHVLSCIEQGFWTPFETSVRCKRGLPVIFRGYLLQLFAYDKVSKQYICRDADACPVALSVIRQCCEYCYKLALPFTEAQKAKAEEDFLATDDSVPTYGEYDYGFVDTIRSNFQTYYPSAFNLSLDDVAEAPRPGPGTYAGCTPEYWMSNYQHPRIGYRGRDLAHRLRFNRRSPKADVVVGLPDYSEVLFVPKDSRGPRVISREPRHNLMFQMGLEAALTRALEYDTGYRVNFKTQQVNRDLVAPSSVDRSMSTLDLKEASDRVSYAIVRHVFRYSPLLKAYDWFRTTRAILPSGRSVTLKKLSGMGSGLTFPTMALLIHVSIVTHVSKVLRVPYRQAMKSVYVFGDDIIVPTSWFDLASEALHKVGLLVNSSKSYRRSYFRESCGSDCYYGNDVAPVRLKLSSAQLKAESTCTSLRYACKDSFVLGLERHARELYKAQCYNTAEYIYSWLERTLGPLPAVTVSSPILGRVRPASEVSESLPLWPDGTHVTEKYWVVKPVNASVKAACPYQYLKRRVGKVAPQSFGKVEALSYVDRAVPFGIAPVPRRIRIVKRKLNSFARLSDV